MKVRISKVAVVTGGSRGLGRAVSRALSDAGYTICVNYISDENSAAEALGGLRPGSFDFRADVSDASDVAAMASAVMKTLGRVDLLVNNAGITEDSLLVRQGESQWRRVLDANLKGCFNTTRAFAPLMAAGGGGHIVNIASRSGIRGRAGQAAYSASKAALIGLTLASAREFGPENIRVNAVVPGYMPTDMGRRAMAAMGAAQRESLLGRLASAEEAASFIVWLASTESITGQVFALDSRV